MKYCTKSSDDYQKQDREIQALLDEIRATVSPHEALRGNVRTNPHRARVAKVFREYRFPVAYMTSFWIAFAEGKPFHRRLWDKTQ
jgi:hypothetical protein